MKTLKEFENLVKFATRPLTLQGDETRAVMWSCAGNLKYFSLPEKGRVRSVCFKKEEAFELLKALKKRVSNDYPKYLSDYKESIEEMHVTARMVEKSIELSDKEKSSAFKKWKKAVGRLYFLMLFPYALEEFLDKECRSLLGKIYGEKSGEIFEAISSPTKLNDYQKMRMEIDEAVIAGAQDKAKEIAEKYFWYSEYTFIEKLLDEKHFLIEVGKLDKDKANAERDKIKEEIKNNKNKFDQVYRNIKDEELKLLARIISDHTYMRTERMDEFKKAMVKIRPFYKKVSQELSVKTKSRWTYLDVNYLLDQEIVSFLEKGNIPDRKEVVKRKTKKYIYTFDTKPKFIYDLKTIKKIDKFVTDSELVDKEIKGVVSYKGIVTGNVSIVESTKDLKKVKERDILVARTTMPDYTSVMKIASAFVTDEGGVTSHAAIISRELKKPCIVGTKIATKVLKDGDMIEVDADKGIVKIIKGNGNRKN